MVLLRIQPKFSEVYALHSQVPGFAIYIQSICKIIRKICLKADTLTLTMPVNENLWGWSLTISIFQRIPTF